VGLRFSPEVAMAEEVVKRHPNPYRVRLCQPNNNGETQESMNVSRLYTYTWMFIMLAWYSPMKTARGRPSVAILQLEATSGYRRSAKTAPTG